MKYLANPIIGPAVAVALGGAVAVALIGAAGSAAAGSSGRSGLYPPVPKVNRHNAIPQKRAPLANRQALRPKLGASAKSGGNGTGAKGTGDSRTGGGAEPPPLGVERPAPERPVPDAPKAGISSPAGVSRTE